MKFLHKLSAKCCRKSLVWAGSTLKCAICNREAGFRYAIGDRLHVYLFQPFKKEQAIVMLDPDTHHIPDRTYLTHQIDFVEFDQAMIELKNQFESIRNWTDETLEEENNDQSGDFSEGTELDQGSGEESVCDEDPESAAGLLL